MRLLLVRSSFWPLWFGICWIHWLNDDSLSNFFLSNSMFFVLKLIMGFDGDCRRRRRRRVVMVMVRVRVRVRVRVVEERWGWVEIGRDAAAFFSDLSFWFLLMHHIWDRRRRIVSLTIRRLPFLAKFKIFWQFLKVFFVNCLLVYFGWSGYVGFGESFSKPVSLKRNESSIRAVSALS